MNEEVLNKIIDECLKHKKHMLLALTKMSPIIPLSNVKYDTLTNDEIEHIDQFLYRYSKLEDTMYRKLFRNLLLFSGERSYKDAPFIDILTKMEKLKILNSKYDWLDLKELCNETTHEYENDAEYGANFINEIIEQHKLLISILDNSINFFKETKLKYN